MSSEAWCLRSQKEIEFPSEAKESFIIPSENWELGAWTQEYAAPSPLRLWAGCFLGLSSAGSGGSGLRESGAAAAILRCPGRAALVLSWEVEAAISHRDSPLRCCVGAGCCGPPCCEQVKLDQVQRKKNRLGFITQILVLFPFINGLCWWHFLPLRTSGTQHCKAITLKKKNNNNKLFPPTKMITYFSAICFL